MSRRIIAVLVSVILAVCGAVLVVMYARSSDARAIAAAQPTTVWVTDLTVPAGTTLKDAQRDNLIVETRVAAAALPAGALQSIDADNNSLLALSDIQAGEFLLAGRFGTTPVGAKAIEVPAGMLAVSVELTDPARVGKFVTPGSHIAVYQSYKLISLADTPQAKIINDKDIKGTSILLDDLLVIGIGETPLAAPVKATDGTDATQAAPSFLVTVAVAPKDAPTLVHGINNRVLYAALRGPDVKIDPKLEITDLTARVSTP